MLNPSHPLGDSGLRFLSRLQWRFRGGFSPPSLFSRDGHLDERLRQTSMLLLLLSIHLFFQNVDNLHEADSGGTRCKHQRFESQARIVGPSSWICTSQFRESNLVVAPWLIGLYAGWIHGTPRHEFPF